MPLKPLVGIKKNAGMSSTFFISLAQEFLLTDPGNGGSGRDGLYPGNPGIHRCGDHAGRDLQQFAQLRQAHLLPLCRRSGYDRYTTMEQNPLPNSFTLGLESMIFSTVFRSRIRMFLGLLDLDPKLFVSIWRRILPSTNKKFEKNLDFCCLVTVLHNQFFFFEEKRKCTYRKQ